MDRIERALWLEEGSDPVPEGVDRVYLGHETCAHRAPTAPELLRAFSRFRDSGIPVTLVTAAFLSQAEIDVAKNLVETAVEKVGPFEVVCNDWGMLHWLSKRRIAEPVAGRWMSGQALDPRFALFFDGQEQRKRERFVPHADGTRVRIEYRPPSTRLGEHLRTSALAATEIRRLLEFMGVRRWEASNPMQGMEPIDLPGRHVTLHVAEVPVTMARRCWGAPEGIWSHPSFPVPLRTRDNAIYYRNDLELSNPKAAGVDRTVERAGTARRPCPIRCHLES